ncbi:MAG: hypothetical protein OEM81_06050 [Acidimicrobiia bacterium]|nr:hypothetical protein [Acidimicrobiia bacterium]MDH3397382.1 hypothetical protein [Acidimicrobiia bacterium]MDH5615264.1 hypothetical protein [Acidimicrobiia bacterium]
MTKAGYCFRCDTPAEGDLCPACGAPPYREEKTPDRKASPPFTVGETEIGRRFGLGSRAVLAIIAVALLLAVIAVVAASTAGVS